MALTMFIGRLCPNVHPFLCPLVYSSPRLSIVVCQFIHSFAHWSVRPFTGLFDCQLIHSSVHRTFVCPLVHSSAVGIFVCMLVYSSASWSIRLSSIRLPHRPFFYPLVNSSAVGLFIYPLVHSSACQLAHTSILLSNCSSVYLTESDRLLDYSSAMQYICQTDHPCDVRQRDQPCPLSMSVRVPWSLPLTSSSYIRTFIWCQFLGIFSSDQMAQRC